VNKMTSILPVYFTQGVQMHQFEWRTTNSPIVVRAYVLMLRAKISDIGLNLELLSNISVGHRTKFY
jgi:hypothetical protein